MLRPREGWFLAQGHIAHGRAKNRTQVSWFPVSTQGSENGQLRRPLPRQGKGAQRASWKRAGAELRREELRGEGHPCLTRSAWDRGPLSQRLQLLEEERTEVTELGSSLWIGDCQLSVMISISDTRMAAESPLISTLSFCR